MRILYSLFFLLLVCSVSSAQDETPKIEVSDFPGSTISRTEHFNGNSLWGYIDGGADLYLEYGFSKLTAQEILYKSDKYRVDIYKMKDAESAFGIFSISRFKCSGEPISQYSCVTEYQVQAAKGSYYISIINDKGSADEQKFCIAMAEKILSRIEEKDYELPALFRNEFAGEAKLLHGILGVQNALSDWESLFDGIKDFTIHFVSIEKEGKYTVTSLIKFGKAEDAEVFKNKSVSRKEAAPDIKLDYKKISETQLLFTETNK